MTPSNDTEAVAIAKHMQGIFSFKQLPPKEGEVYHDVRIDTAAGVLAKELDEARKDERKKCEDIADGYSCSEDCGKNIAGKIAALNDQTNG